jgi:hypothetical protein
VLVISAFFGRSGNGVASLAYDHRRRAAINRFDDRITD